MGEKTIALLGLIFWAVLLIIYIRKHIKINEK